MTLPKTEPPLRRKRYEEIVDHLQLMIFANELRVGDQLPSERDLMQRFSVGRSSVREALFTLNRMGLISVSTGAPARVVRPDIRTLLTDLTGAVRHLMVTPQGIRQLQAARMLLEVGLAREAARDATPDDIDRLEQALAANRQAIDDLEEFQRTDFQFHHTIAAITGSPIFASLLEFFAEWLAEQRAGSVKSGAKPEPVFREHEAIFLAIADKDPVAAQDAMERHLKGVAAHYWAQLSE